MYECMLSYLAKRHRLDFSNAVQTLEVTNGADIHEPLCIRNAIFAGRQYVAVPPLSFAALSMLNEHSLSYKIY